MRRYISLDVLRGIGILGVVYLHSSLFHYGDIMNVDFDNPPPVVTVIGLLLMWGGLFAVISGAANGSMMYGRFVDGKSSPDRVLRGAAATGLFILLLHYVYFLFLGPALLDLETGDHSMSVLAGFIRHGAWRLPRADRVFYSTALSMVGWNVILVGVVLYFLLRNGGHQKPKRNYAIMAALGMAVVVVSLIRIPLYPLSQQAIERGNYPLAFLLGFTVNKNDPVLPYFGFGLFGAMIGVALARGESHRKIREYFGLTGVGWLAAGVIGLMLLPDTMLERAVDAFWFFLIVVQLGLFILLVVALLWLLDFCPEEKRWRRAGLLRWVRRFGMVSLSVFMLETPLSGVLARLADAVFPGWNMSMNVTFMFAAFNVVIWLGLVKLWEVYDFRYSFEWIFVNSLERLAGRRSAKMKIKENLGRV